MAAGVAEKDIVHGPTCAELEGIRLRCPRCRVNLSSRDCWKCGFKLEIRDRILHALSPERVEHYAHFIRDYERIRGEEGRGSEDDEFYLRLPYRDVTGRNSGQWEIRARTHAFVMKHILKPRLPAGSRILDLGAGNCWMSFRLALAGYKSVAVDLLTNSRDGLGAAGHYRTELAGLFPLVRAELSRLPFQDGQVNAAIFNASFHYAEDPQAALGEALRCVKRDGLVLICDTPWYTCDESGEAMVRERRESFLRRHGTRSASLESLEFLTDERLRQLEESLAIRWHVDSPNYGLRWALRPYFAKMRKRREPARFRIYVAQRA